MNYVDLVLGIWYLQGGMYEIVKGMVSVVEEQGVEICYNEEVQQIIVLNGYVIQVVISNGFYKVDVVVGGVDYYYLEQVVLLLKLCNYLEFYW